MKKKEREREKGGKTYVGVLTISLLRSSFPHRFHPLNALRHSLDGVDGVGGGDND